MEMLSPQIRAGLRFTGALSTAQFWWPLFSTLDMSILVVDLSNQTYSKIEVAAVQIQHLFEYFTN